MKRVKNWVLLLASAVLAGFAILGFATLGLAVLGIAAATTLVAVAVGYWRSRHYRRVVSSY